MTTLRDFENERLAVEGGPPVFPANIQRWPPRYPQIKAALDEVWESGDWGRYEGTSNRRLTAQLSEFHDGAEVFLCSSGTIGVELALRGLAIEPRDEVVLAGYDFPGNFRAIEALGARPILVDLQPGNWCLSASEFERVLSPKVRAVIVSHLHGGIADLPEISRICRTHKVGLIEDVCQAPGAQLHDRKLGTWGDVAVWSFGGSKLLTAGRGGAVISSRADVMQRLRIFADRGNQAFPLSEIQACVLIPQLDRLLDDNRERNRALVRLLHELQGCSWLHPLPPPQPGESRAFYKVAWLYHPAAARQKSRDEVVRAARGEGVALDAGFRGFVQRSERRCTKPRPLPASSEAAERTLILHHPILLDSDETICRTAYALKKIGRAWNLNDAAATVSLDTNGLVSPAVPPRPEAFDQRG